MTTFADQAVIAIENVRLFEDVQARTRELTEALEQQTATAEVLRVISSSPGELAPVFEAMLANANRLCEATYGILWLREGDGFRIAALDGRLGGRALAEGNAVPAVPEVPLARVMQIRKPSMLPTCGKTHHTSTATHCLAPRWTSPECAHCSASRCSRRTTSIGAIAIYRTEVRPFSDKQIELVTNFASQAVIAIENTRLLNELRARTSALARSVEELRGLGDVTQAVNSTLDLQTVLDTIVARATQLSGTEAGAIYVFDQTQVRVARDLRNDRGHDRGDQGAPRRLFRSRPRGDAAAGARSSCRSAAVFSGQRTGYASWVIAPRLVRSPARSRSDRGSPGGSPQGAR